MGRPPDFVYHAIVFATSFLIYLNSLDGDFVYDDRQAIVSNGDVLGNTDPLSVLRNDFWGSPLAHPGSHKSYRPVTTLSFRANYLAGGMNPTGFHLVNVFLHCACSCLVFSLSQLFVNSKVIRLLISSLFAVHSIHTEAVSSIVGRADLLSTLFVLIGLVFFRHKEDIATHTVLTSLAMFSKETGIVLLPLLVVHRLLTRHKPSSCLRLSMCLVSLGFFRHWLNDFTSPMFSQSDNPIAFNPSWLVRSATFLYLPLFHLGLMIYPDTLCFDWSMDSISPVDTATDRRVFVMGFFYVLLANSIWSAIKEFRKDKKRKSTEELCSSGRFLFALSLLIFPHLLASNLFAYVGFVVAERILYLTSVGYCMIVGMAVERVHKRFGWCLFLMGTVVLAMMAHRTIQRNEDWRDELDLFQSATKINPAKAYANLGQVLASRGRSKEAEEAYLFALRHRPNMADTHYNLGVLYGDRGNQSQAIRFYKNAIAIRPTFSMAHLNLGLCLRVSGQPSEALEVFIRCADIDGTKTKTYNVHRTAVASCAFNSGVILASNGRHEEAVGWYRKALNLAPSGYPSMPSILNMLGDSLLSLGDEGTAEVLFHRALELSPQHTPALLTTANLRIKQNRTSEAWLLLREAVRVSPLSAQAHLHLGLALARNASVDAAMAEFEKALQLDPLHEETLFAIATLHRQNGRNGKAETFFRRLSSLRPSPQNLASLGAILHVNEKWDEAETVYQKVLEISPGDTVTKENLEKMRRARRKRQRK